ncbi:hypothetical protein [Solitalea koreensis]|uniref:Hemolysin III n=1 Tax=Solitalea koreensis TaxID=543615 RepID=A0A521B1R2_9SPHI|nr:hypothetical protein [Solitalea koreensis]SMO41034.1 hypothetical protein SAMN06265350_101618 [Solitalea koreensis]
MITCYTLLQILSDGGPIYAETNLHRTIVEPFNAASGLLFVFLAIFWFYKLRGNYKKYPFLSISLVVLTIGAIGGTLYHALRESKVFLLMDWLPIVILSLMASFYFLIRVTKNVVLSTSIFALLMGLQFLIYKLSGEENSHLSINLNYITMAIVIAGPTIFFLLMHKFYNWRLVAIGFTAFGVALFFRIADKWAILPMGTHFLWHLFGLIAVNCMFQFIYHVNTYDERILIPSQQSFWI